MLARPLISDLDYNYEHEFVDLTSASSRRLFNLSTCRSRDIDPRVCRAIRRARAAEPSNATLTLRPVAGRVGCGFMGYARCVAQPSHPTLRYPGYRGLGNRPDSGHAVAAFAF